MRLAVLASSFVFAGVRSAAGVVAVMAVPYAFRKVGTAVTGLQPDEWNRRFWQKVCAFSERRIAAAEVRGIKRREDSDL